VAPVPRHSVLVVEDDAPIRELIQDVLTEEGFNVVTAEDGAQAIQILQQLRPLEEHFCVIFLDLMLPKVAGHDVLRYLHQRGDVVPVVAMSASREHLAQAIIEGAHVAVAKPFEIEDLLALVVRHCPRQHS
jgi:two-component system phosphate regulon response regulator PhoB